MTKHYVRRVKRRFIQKQYDVIQSLGIFTSFDTLLKALYDIEGLSSTEISYFFHKYCGIDYSRQKISKRIRQLGIMRDVETAKMAKRAPIKRSMDVIYEDIRFGGTPTDTKRYRR